uniref:MRN complex-interacting protein N-terminal domain-containing protein n=1 Tax=Anabas testudineus TaxID=64144 RepID=A0A3Q1JAA6_ANATE
ITPGKWARLYFCCVKKATRWSCKLCGEKQSLLKEFGRGSGADCRRHVQKLNAMRGAVMDELILPVRKAIIFPV